MWQSLNINLKIMLFMDGHYLLSRASDLRSVKKGRVHFFHKICLQGTEFNKRNS